MRPPDAKPWDELATQDPVTVFRWPVCTAGYEIARQRPYVDPDTRFAGLRIASGLLPGNILQKDRIPVLIEKEKIEEGVRLGTLPKLGQLRFYNPLVEEPGLFRRFSELPTDDPDAWVQFANNYGLLGIGVSVAETDDEYPEREAELPDAWAYHVWKMKAMVRLWSLWRDQKNESALREVIKPHDRGNGYWNYADAECPPVAVRYLPKKYVPNWRYERIGGVPLPPELQQNHNDVRTAAAVFLQSRVNEQLAGYASPGLIFEPETRRLVLRLRPLTLLGAMWLQFAQAINEDDVLHPCASCGKWFVVNNAKDARRKRKRFCSVLCKLHDHRRRQTEALRLADEKVTPSEIATRTGTPLKTVKNWIRQSHTTRKGK